MVPVSGRWRPTAGPGQRRHHEGLGRGARALEAGATIVNDVSAGRHDPDLLGVVADAGAGYVAMHMHGEPRTMQDDPRYDDVVREVGDFLVERLDVAADAGIARESLMADPGIGFGKTGAHNLTLLAATCELVAERVGVPLLVGASRKTFIGRLLDVDDADGPRRRHARHRRLGARPAARAMVRVHDVRGAASRRRPACPSSKELLRDEETSCDRTLRGRWAQGLEPRFFCWIVRDRLAASERPGRLRPEPPQDPPPGGADLARPARVHPRDLAARLAAQPAGVRRGRASSTSTSRSGGTTSWRTGSG